MINAKASFSSKGSLMKLLKKKKILHISFELQVVKAWET